MPKPPIIPNKDKGREKLFGTPHILAEMYYRWTLDCFPVLAEAISHDTISSYRNRHYSVPLDVGENVENLLYTVGNDPNWPDATQRRMRYSAYFGESDGDIKLKTISDEGDIAGRNFEGVGIDGFSQFYQSRLSLLYSAARFMFRRFEESIEIMRNEFRHQVLKFQAYLTSFPANTNWDKQGKNIFDKSIEVIKSKQIAGAFGVNPPVDQDWPLYGNVDGQGAFMIEVISRTLNLNIETLTLLNFNALQLAAEKGRLTVTGVMN